MLPIRTAKSKDNGHILLVASLVIVALAAAFLVGAKIWYDQNLQPAGSSHEGVHVTIDKGSSRLKIADQLHELHLIRSVTAFNIYVRLHKDQASLKAGSYLVRPDQSTPEIVGLLAGGKEAADKFTIIPGSRLDQIRQKLIDHGYSPSDVDAALQPAQYAAHPALEAHPAGASLEGYLYPETFQVTASTTPQQIIRLSLDEMAKRLTVDRLQAYRAEGLTPFQAITLASIIEEEVEQPADKATVAQIFLKRLQEGISLGSDVTYMYAAAVTGQIASPDLDSPYNTRKYSGLPPGPISNVTDSSLEAVAHPAKTNYLFFITGDDGKVYYGATQADHDRNIKLYCQKTCGL